MVAGLVMIVGPFLAAAIAPGVAWVAWLARSLPGALVVSGTMVWFRADKVFDRGFDPVKRTTNANRSTIGRWS